MNTKEQISQQLERLIRKVADKFPATEEATLLTDIHLRANQETGELVAFDDDDNEITRVVVEQWIGNTDHDFYESITTPIRKCIEKQSELVEQMSVLKPYSFVLEDEEREGVSELYVVDGDTVIIDEELMKDLDTDLNDFLAKLLKD